MINTAKINTYFFICFLFYLLTGGVVLVLFSKGEVVLFLNSVHNPFCDIFFKYFTFLGSGWLFVLITILLFFYRIKYGMLSLSCSISTLIILQFLKRIIFSESDRPKIILKEITELNFVDGVSVYSFNSFPSGHTATAFSIFCLLTFLINSTVIKSSYYILGLLFFLLAFIVSISRIYLLQHFFIDTYVGAIIGIIITSTCYYFMERSKMWYKNKVMNKPIVNLFRHY